VGPNSLVGIAAHYGLDDPGSKPSEEGRDLLHPSKPVLVPSQPPVKWVSGFFLRVKVVGAWHKTFTPYSAEVQERVELYLYFVSGPSWPVVLG